MDAHASPDIVIVAAGDPPPARLADVIRDAPLRIGVDGGVDHLLAIGATVDVAVGDFDSLSPSTAARLDEVAGTVRRHPTDKDATDLTLALREARGRGRRALVCGVEGGRPDHATAAMGAMGDRSFADLELCLGLDGATAWVVRDHLDATWPAGDVVSVVPLHGPATVSLTGCRWRLDQDVLEAGTTRGVSNEVQSSPVRLTVHAGTVVCFHLPSPDPRTLESP